MTGLLRMLVVLLLLTPVAGRAEDVPQQQTQIQFQPVEQPPAQVQPQPQVQAAQPPPSQAQPQPQVQPVQQRQAEQQPPAEMQQQPTAAAAVAAETPPATASAGPQAEIAAVMADEKSLIRQVAAIINQPVTQYARVTSIQPAIFSPGWFHDGGIKPDFDKVDVQKTRELPYDKFEYVSSDLNPTVMFKGADLEFNTMTKYFYMDRSVPKKKLDVKEMTEINRLYRLLGKDEHRLEALRGGVGGKAAAKAPPPKSGFKKFVMIVLGAGVAFLISMMMGRKKPVQKGSPAASPPAAPPPPTA